MSSYMFYDCALGKLYLEEQNGCVAVVSFRIPPKLSCSADPHPILLQCVKQLEEYFKGKRQKFDLPLAPRGTDFMQKVWHALQDIPYGFTQSYQEIATRVGNIKACRAVGLANNRNPLVIIIPCHRVIGKNGSLVGYGGGLNIKKFLLLHEQRYVHV